MYGFQEVIGNSSFFAGKHANFWSPRIKTVWVLGRIEKTAKIRNVKWKN